MVSEELFYLVYNNRIHYLDGIRGWAALMVVCFHLLWETFGNIQPLYHNMFTSPLLYGDLAVSIFFIISGAALSASYFRGGGFRAIETIAVKRYFRLSLPVFFSSIFVYLVLLLGLNYNFDAAIAVSREVWLGSFASHQVSLSDVLRFSFIDVYAFSVNDAAISLNPFLWTMRIELIGSAFVFSFLIIFYFTKNITTVYLTLIGLMIFIATADAATHYSHHAVPYIFCFFAGMTLSKLGADGLIHRYHHNKIFNIVMIVIFICAMVSVSFFRKNDLQPATEYTSAIVVYTLSFSKALNYFMSNRLSQFLGRISFPIFLFQHPVIISITSFLIVEANKYNVLVDASFVIFLLSLAICIICSILFSIFEDITQFFCRAVASLFMRSVHTPCVMLFDGFNRRERTSQL